ncbi:MAG: PAS domain S-box protein [Magnetospirillum sp.]|nr:MAG: PAS domain S-box protein [Magnetospirillum sp.]
MGTIGRIRYIDLIDRRKLQSLMDSFHEVIGIANAVIDVDGVVIAHAGWQDACTAFHRVNPDTCRRCIESDTALAESTTHGAPFAIYRCHNGLVDTAAPIIVDGQHVANVFTGQFLTEPPDLEFFRAQARTFCFDEARYLEAIARVPILPQGQAESVTRLYAQLASMLADNGLDRLRQQNAVEALANLNAALEGQVAARAQALAEAHQEVAGREALLQQILDTANVGIFLVDTQGYIIHANPCMAELFGRPVEMLVGDEYVALIHPSEREIGRQKMLALLASAIPSVNLERLYWRADHTTFWGHLTGKRFYDTAGKKRGLVGVIADITEHRTAADRLAEINHQLESQAEQLRRSNAELEQFAYVASHDLQEPLRMISSYAQLIARRYGDKLDDNAREFITFMLDGTSRMQAMIQDLLEFSRIGRREAEPAEMEAADGVAAALRNLAAAIDKAGATVACGALPRIKVRSPQFIALMQNLIGNAVKYRHPDRPAMVRIDARRTGGDWEFTVADNGIGIRPEYFDRIFLIFQRLHTRDAYEGSGIGLAICKKIVEHHDGRIWVESVPGEGSTFHFTLPDRP